MASVYQTHVKQALGLPTLPRRQDAATLEAKRQRMARQIERRRQALILGPTPWGSRVEGGLLVYSLRSLPSRNPKTTKTNEGFYTPKNTELISQVIQSDLFGMVK